MAIEQKSSSTDVSTNPGGANTRLEYPHISSTSTGSLDVENVNELLL